MEKILLATSIAPFDIDNQRLAIESWIEAGFEVISCNVRSEIKQIEPFFTNIRFIPLERDGTEATGKPYPYIYDVLQILRQEKHRVCGFLNSDIHLLNFPKELMNIIYESVTSGAFVYSHRMETISWSMFDQDTAYSLRIGVDFFCFDKVIIDIFQDDNMLVGKPMMDYWFLGIADINEIFLREVKNPVFYHISHKARWDTEFNVQLKQQIAEKYFMNSVRMLSYRIRALFCDITNGILYQDEETKTKRVLVVFPESEDTDEATLHSFEMQTHRNFDVFWGEPKMERKLLYDYIFYASNKQQYMYTALSVILYEMDRRKSNALQCEVALVTEDEECGSKQMYVKTIKSVNNENTICVSGSNGIITPEAFRMPLSIISINAALERYINKYEQFYVYPAGEMSREIVGCLDCQKAMGLLGLCDRNEHLWGREIGGYSIYPPSILDNTDGYDKVLVISRFEDEIVNELKEKLPSDKIVCLS